MSNPDRCHELEKMLGSFLSGTPKRRRVRKAKHRETLSREDAPKLGQRAAGFVLLGDADKARSWARFAARAATRKPKP